VFSYFNNKLVYSGNRELSKLITPAGCEASLVLRPHIDKPFKIRLKLMNTSEANVNLLCSKVGSG